MSNEDIGLYNHLHITHYICWITQITRKAQCYIVKQKMKYRFKFWKGTVFSIRHNSKVKPAMCFRPILTRFWGWDTQPTRTQDNTYPGQLVSKTTRSQDNSYPGQLVTKTTRTKITLTQENSYPGKIVLKETRTQDNLYPGKSDLKQISLFPVGQN